jgi:nicotinamidase-related amidase
MGGRRNGRAFECVIVDVNTQRDFCEADGARPVANAPLLIGQLRRVVAWAKRNQAPVISSVEAHRPFELSDAGHPPCCVDGSCGQRKLEFTLFPAHAWLEADNTLAVPPDLFSHYQQVIFQKRTDDLLSNPKADRLLGQLPAQEYILFGTGLECSVKALALALLARGKQVTVVVDACGFWHRATADLALRQIAAKGARLSCVDELRLRKLDRHYRYSLLPEMTNGNGHGHGNGQGNGNGHSRFDDPPAQGRTNGHLPTLPISTKLRGRNGNRAAGLSPRDDSAS